MLLASATFLYYLLKYLPFVEPLDQVLNLFSTSVLIVLYLICFLLSLIHSSYALAREVLGFLFIALVLVFFLVNIVAIVVSKVKKCIQEKRKKAKQRRAKRRAH